MAYICTCVQNLGAIRRPVRKTCLSSLIIDAFRFLISSTKLDFKIAIFHTDIVSMTGIAFFEV